MKKLVILLIFLNLSFHVFATEQYPDKLLYNGLTLTLNTGWGHPSPLQTYFYQNRQPYPFTMLSTANYRGHIATWVIQDDKFYLKEVERDGKLSSPGKYGIKPAAGISSKDNLFFADWFSGIIECNRSDDKDKRKTTSTFYFQIRRGEIISGSEITGKDFERIRKISAKDTANKDLMTKYELLLLNRNYITYYYRLNENDAIGYKGKPCKLNTGYSRLSPIYGLYSNQHLNWPFNWENLGKCGAPNCKWAVVNDSLFLTGIQLYSGLQFDTIDKEDIELTSLLPGKTNNDRVFADWVTGVQLIIYGVDTTHSFGFKEYQPKEYTYCRIENGLVKEAYSIPADFDMKKDEASLDPRLRALMKEY